MALFYIIFNGLRTRLSEAHVPRRSEAHLARPARPRVAEDLVLALRGAHPAATAPRRRNDSPGAWRARAPSPRAAALRHANPAGPSYPLFYPRLMAGLCLDMWSCQDLHPDFMGGKSAAAGRYRPQEVLRKDSFRTARLQTYAVPKRNSLDPSLLPTLFSLGWQQMPLARPEPSSQQKPSPDAAATRV